MRTSSTASNFPITYALGAGVCLVVTQIYRSNNVETTSTAPAATDAMETGSTIGRAATPTGLRSDSTRIRIATTVRAITAITQ